MGWFGHTAVSLSLCLAVVDVAVSSQAAAANMTPLDQAEFINWSGRQHQKTVNDGSVLTEYQGLTEANNRPGMMLKVSFSPRFSCTPMISFLTRDAGVELGSAKPAIDTESSDADVAVARTPVSIDTGEFPDFRDDELLDLRVDGISVDYPLIVDADDGAIWIFNGDQRERETLRLQIDIGDVAAVTVAENRKIIFSLLGSRKTLKALQTLCRQHEPIPFDD